MKQTLILIILLSLMTSCTDSEIKDSCTELDRLDKKMLEVIDSIENKYFDQEAFLNRLRDAQIFWIQYKDRHVRALYPLNKNYYSKTFGVDYNECKCAEWARLTKNRIEELSIWLDGASRYDECPASIMTNKIKKP